MASAKNRASATTKWLKMPASTTIDFCQNGASRYVRPSSSGATSSNGFIPMMRTYPPSGISFTPYSVSPRVNDQILGPKPKNASVAFIPNALAATKCPASWMTTISTTPRMMTKAPMKVSDSGW